MNLLGNIIWLIFAGIQPIDVPAFVAAQLLGAAAATALFRWLLQ